MRRARGSISRHVLGCHVLKHTLTIQDCLKLAADTVGSNPDNRWGFSQLSARLTSFGWQLRRCGISKPWRKLPFKTGPGTTVPGSDTKEVCKALLGKQVWDTHCGMGKQNVGWPSNETVSIVNFYTQADLENAQHKNEGHKRSHTLWLHLYKNV